jgi:hypothetical protein
LEVRSGGQPAKGRRALKITIESTTKKVFLDGIPARIWEGQSDGGVKVICFISRVAVAEGQDVSQFQKELSQQRPPSVEAEAFPLRMIL